MNRRACLLALAAGLAGCAEAPAAPGEPVAKALADPRDLVAFLPASTDSVLTIDLVHLRAATFARPLLRSISQAEEAPAARKERGFDEIVDVDRYVFARMGPPGGERATLELVRGRFDPARVGAAFLARWPGASETEFGATGGYTSAAMALALLAPDVLVFGPAWAVRLAAGVRQGREPSVAGAAWLTQANPTWARDTTERAGPPALELVLRATGGSRAELGQLLGTEVPIDHLAARIEVGVEARALVIATATSPEKAEALAGELRDAIGGLRGRPSVEALGLGPVVNRADIATRGARVALVLAITERERDTVASKLAALGALLARRRGQATE